MEPIELKKVLPVVKIYSKYFADKTLNIERAVPGLSFGDYPAGNTIKFDKDGFAEVNPTQFDSIDENTAYNLYVVKLEEYDKEFTHVIYPEAE